MRRGLLRRALIAVAFAALPGQAAVAGDCVILLHGLARTAHSMGKIEEAFLARGFKVANVGYASRRYRIEQLAAMAVTQGLARCEAGSLGQPGRVHFVAHSLGAILVRQHLVHHAVPNLGRVVMLAPPNQGSEIVDSLAGMPGFTLLAGRAVVQLGTGADSVPLQLGPVDYPVGIIAGTRSINPLLSSMLPNPDDGKVAVARTRLAGMAGFITLPVSHTFIMRSERAIAQAVAFIESGAFLWP